jgi:hypothetical protein
VTSRKREIPELCGATGDIGARAVVFAIGQPDDLEINESLFGHAPPDTAMSETLA